MSMLGLASKLRVTPSVAIEQARLDMQFNRAQASVARHGERGDGYAVELREFVAREYDAFTATLAEWSATRDAWIAATREQVAEQLERIDFTDLRARNRTAPARATSARRADAACRSGAERLTVPEKSRSRSSTLPGSPDPRITSWRAPP